MMEFAAKFFPTLSTLLLSLGFARELPGQAMVRVDSNHVETGNAFVFKFSVPNTVGKPDSLGLAPWSQFLPEENILEESSWVSTNSTFEKSIRAVFFEEDSLHLNPAMIFLSSGDTAFTQPLRIVVTATPSPDDLNDMAPIKDIHREPTLWTDYLPWILGGLALVALLFLFYRFAKRSSRQALVSRSIELPAHELALRKLAVLLKKDWVAQGRVKEHYTELTFVVREYLEKRFGAPALESTTEETLAHLKTRAFPSHLEQPLHYLLSQSDLTKFAKIIPPESFHAEALAIAQKIIVETIPPETSTSSIGNA